MPALLPRPLIAIDHVIHRGPLVAGAAETVESSGSDHAALVAQLHGVDPARSR